MYASTALTESLALAALIAATLEYAILLRHRAEARRRERLARDAEQVGLRGLVRIFLADER